MSEQKVTGQCHCGNVKYSVNETKLFEFLCHCDDCRTLNSGGHLSGIIFQADSLQTEGDINEYNYPGGSGQEVQTRFCPNCSTTLYAFPLAHPDSVVVRANTLDDPNIFKPQQSLFGEKAFDWDVSVIKEKSS